jgi:hypothetical protein
VASHLVWGQEDHRSSRWRETTSRKTIPAGAGHRLERGWTGKKIRLRVGTSRLPPVFAATKDRPSQANPTAQGSKTRCRCPGGSRTKDSGHARATTFFRRDAREAIRALPGKRLVAAMRHQGSNPCLSARSPWIAQLAEQRVDNAQVLRSTRSPGTMVCCLVSSMGRAPVSKTGSGGSSPSRDATGRMPERSTALFRKQMGGDATGVQIPLLPPDFLAQAQGMSIGLRSRRVQVRVLRARPTTTACRATGCAQARGSLRPRLRSSPR